MSSSPLNPSYLEDASGYRGEAEQLHIPQDESELLQVLAEARAAGAALTIAGAGTGLTGARCPAGGWIISLERFTRLEIHPGHAIAGAGVLLRDLQAAARASGQFYAPDPTETAASIGGTIATNASGSRSFLYGPTRRHVRRLRVALADGRVLDVKRGDAIDFEVPAIPRPAALKHSAGFLLSPGMDWIDLFTGSEGTLGILLEAELTLLESPPDLLSGVVFFADDHTAMDAVDVWRGVPGLRMLEYMDAGSLRLLEPRYPEIPPAARAAVLVEQGIEGKAEESDEVDAWFERLEAAHALGEESWFGISDADRERFRRFRHALPELVNDTVRRNGWMKLGSDYAVPVVRNREMLAYYRARLEKEFPGRFVVFGHIGDAHVHTNILPSSSEEFDRAKDLLLDFARQAVNLGGTVSAEHGLGKRKAHLMAIQYAPEHLEAMRAVKRRLDPEWRLGQGTLFSCE